MLLFDDNKIKVARKPGRIYNKGVNSNQMPSLGRVGEWGRGGLGNGDGEGRTSHLDNFGDTTRLVIAILLN